MVCWQIIAMRSKAHFKSHPLHPILVAFPIAFFIGAFVFDSLSLLRNNAGFWQTGGYLAIAGIIGALLAAVPGAIDYFYTVPPKSSAKKRGAKHAVINLLNVFLFVFAVYYRNMNASSHVLVLVLEAIGVALLSIAGWMGGTLVHRNQIGVDHHYANAGKWNEAYFEKQVGKLEVAQSGDLKVNALKLLHVGDKRIVLGRTEEGYVAFDDRCTHKGGSLAGGVMGCHTVHCPWHGSQFDVVTGQTKAGPAKDAIKTYVLEEVEGKVFLIL